MEILNENMNALDLDELEKVTGGMSYNVVDMQTLVVNFDANESAVTALAETKAAGIKFMGMKISISDPQGKLMAASAELDKNIANPRRCVIRFRLNGFTEAIINSVEL